METCKLHPGYVGGKCIGCGIPMPEFVSKPVRVEPEYVRHRPRKSLCMHPTEARYTGVVCGDEVVFCNFCTERVS